MQKLVAMATDVYSDSLLETMSAWSWPARYLAHEHSERVNKMFAEHGWDWDFASSDPDSVSLHYLYPAVYREMLQVIADMEMKKLGTSLQSCMVFSA